MLLSPRHYLRFLDGRNGPFAIVGFLPGDLAARMPTLSTEVRIGRDYAKKLWEKHHLGHGDLGMIQRAIDHGWCTKSRGNALDFLYVDTAGQPLRFILGLKSAYGGAETWVTTLHKSDEQQIRRRLRRARAGGTLLRAHSWT
jgi:hypothetical protein